ncbi:hypothetical protein JW859_07220 [bacterium]|nr:hypothetical protein [bacterium]
MGINCLRLSLLGLLAAVLLGTPAGAQDPPADIFGGGEPTVGEIPGTGMLRDEFRARANIQLSAIALNALTYRILHDDTYPTDLITLLRSEAWNLDVTNMFTGRRLQAIYFVPGEDDMTTLPVMDLAMLIDQETTDLGFVGNAGGTDYSQLGEMIAGATPSALPRVDPRRIRTYTGGDVYYYASGDLLQLIMFTPDGGFLEYVDETPRRNWHEKLTGTAAMWPDSVLVSAVLFFCENLLLPNYNMVEFMGNRATLPVASFDEIGAGQRVELAAALNIAIRNALTGEPVGIAAEYSAGDFAPGDPAAPTPLLIYLRDRQTWTLEKLAGIGDNGPEQLADGAGPNWSGDKPSRPPLGGRK